MEIAAGIIASIVPFALKVARDFMESQAKKGGLTQQEAALIALFDAVVAYINASKEG